MRTMPTQNCWILNRKWNFQPRRRQTTIWTEKRNFIAIVVEALLRQHENVIFESINAASRRQVGHTKIAENYASVSQPARHAQNKWRTRWTTTTTTTTTKKTKIVRKSKTRAHHTHNDNGDEQQRCERKEANKFLYPFERTWIGNIKWRQEGNANNVSDACRCRGAELWVSGGEQNKSQMEKLKWQKRIGKWNERMM